MDSMRDVEPAECAATSPVAPVLYPAGDGPRWSCTRAPGHEGDHEARVPARRRPVATWAGAA